jgi:hypothetical protein
MDEEIEVSEDALAEDDDAPAADGSDLEVAEPGEEEPE